MRVPARKNVSGRIEIAIVHRPAIRADPLSYSKIALPVGLLQEILLQQHHKPPEVLQPRWPVKFTHLWPGQTPPPERAVN